MRLLTAALPFLSALCATALDTAPPPSQHAFSFSSLPHSAWSPTQVHSQIELGGSLTRSQAVYSLVKDSNSKGGDTFVVGVRNSGQPGGWVEATEGKGQLRKPVELTTVGSDDDTTYYSVSLSPSTEATTLSLAAVQSHVTRPYPPQLPQNADSIYMLWEGDLLAPLAGLSAEQKSKIEAVSVKVKTPTPRILNLQLADESGFEVNHPTGSATVTYTSKGSVASLGPQVARVHYQQPQAIASIRKLDRVVELSHWGSNLAIQDTIDLANTGPTLEGHFARIDYQKASMHRRQGALAISSLTVPLPSSAHSPYFYDLVGNVSTSRFRPSSASSSAVLPSQKKKSKAAQPALLELQPRYPLMGGWNYSFTIGYDLPLEEFLRVGKEDGRYSVAVPFLTALKDVAVDEARVQVRLPEGARDIQVHAPFPLDALTFPEPLVKTYLDIKGRPTVYMEKRGCTDRHGGEVIITYTLPFFAAYVQKPLAVAVALFGIFTVVVGAKRLRWSIA
ncbi:hypothetical protein JCM8097_000119 [Rhodosporidiobolus ruineniae]